MATEMTAATVRPDLRAGAALGTASVGCLIAMPAIMAVAHRSSPLVVTLAALFALGAAAAETRLPELWRGLGDAARSPLGIAILAFLAWGAVSLAWSPIPGLGLASLGEFALPLGAALVLGLVVPERLDRRATLFFAVGLMVAAVIVLADLSTGLAGRRAVGMRAELFVLNRPALTLLVLLPACLSLLIRERRIWLAAAVAVLVGLAILKSQSGAAKLGLAALFVTGGLALVSRGAGLALAGAALLAALALAPVKGELADRYLPPSLYRVLERAHARERVDIWRSFGAALRERPILGAGFGASARMGEAPVARRVAPDFATLLAVGHPHDAALQVWVELGAVGAFLAALVAALLLRAMARLERADMAVAASLLAAALADSLVGQGAWQGWWPAAIGASLVWFTYGRSRPNGVVHGSA